MKRIKNMNHTLEKLMSEWKKKIVEQTNMVTKQ